MKKCSLLIACFGLIGSSQVFACDEEPTDTTCPSEPIEAPMGDQPTTMGDVLDQILDDATGLETY